MTTTMLDFDPDILHPDDPDRVQPDHDESLSPWLVPEEDESTTLWTPPTNIEVSQLKPRSLMDATATAAPDVKFMREIRQGMVGKDVVAHKRALSRARPDLYPWPTKDGFTPLAGSLFLDAVVKYKKAHRLGTARVLGGVAHESLERQHRKGHPTEWAFDALAIQLAKEYWDEHHISPETRVRNAIVSAGFFWYSHRFNIAYSQYRPFQLGKPPFVPSRWDCSAFTTNCHYAGGAPNPNGRPWDHLGYTGTLMSRGTKVGSVTYLKPGDMIFYGFASASAAFPAGSPTHVALYVGKINNQHMVLSMGSYPMKYVVYSYRHDVNHFRTYTVA